MCTDNYVLLLSYLLLCVLQSNALTVLWSRYAYTTCRFQIRPQLLAGWSKQKHVLICRRSCVTSLCLCSFHLPVMTFMICSTLDYKFRGHIIFKRLAERFLLLPDHKKTALVCSVNNIFCLLNQHFC